MQAIIQELALYMKWPVQLGDGKTYFSTIYMSLKHLAAQQISWTKTTEGKHSNMEVWEAMPVLPINKIKLQVEQESQEEF